MGRVGLGVAAGCAAATCAIAAVLVARRASARARWRRAVALLREFEEGCATPPARLRQVVDAMVVEMHAGLASDGGSKLKMLLTFVDALPTGNEEGIYYAIDLGGTNFRALRVEVGAGSVVTSREVELPIPEELTKGTIEELFNFVAVALKDFVEREDGKDEQKALGFTFSFPVRQTSVSSGSLIRWTKGFSIENAVGKDVAQCLNESLAGSGLNVRVTALVNDTVGTLALGHYHDEDTVAAVIIGAGTNACYIERSDAIIKCQGLLTNSGGMVVNMEWGNFWSSHLPRTPYDISLDDETQNRNDQVALSVEYLLQYLYPWLGFEKMISGIYLGEIARLVLHRMALESDVFGDAADNLSTPFTLSTPLLAAIREDDSPDLSEVRRILQEHLKIPDTPLKTRRLVVKVCDIVTRRAARLAAAGIVGILKKLGRDGSGVASSGRMRGQPRRTVVAIEGGLYQGYPVFREYLDEALVEIMGEEVARTVALRVTEDGSGVGAALLAAVHSSNRQQEGSI
ncbi:hexokinase-3 [Panicum miliaceum]|uniref:Phosphotransferase n=1 Tax=Panicum miliaceum TaxID=4540 RepID=A0A3L6SH63_PANMI|nr:hexokinase-3 [Panicum miliaceum]